jgi:hypothetical protein
MTKTMATQAGRDFWFALRNALFAWCNHLGVGLAAPRCVGAELAGAEGLAAVLAVTGRLLKFDNSHDTQKFTL